MSLIGAMLAAAVQVAPAAAPAAPVEEGTVMLSCRLLSNRRVAHCRVLEENPPGEGMGKVALQIAKKLRFPEKYQGVTGTIRIPVRIKLVDELPTAAAAN